MLAQDHIEVYEASGPNVEGCQCEQALQATVDRLNGEVLELRAEVLSLQQADREAWTLAEEVLQAVTLDEAKRRAAIYLGLADPF